MIRTTSFIITVFLFCVFNLYAQTASVINFGKPSQNSLCSDGWMDGDGNTVVSLYSESTGFMIGSFDQYLNTNWIKEFGVDSGAGGKLIRLTSGNFFTCIVQDSYGKGHLFMFNSNGDILWHKVLSITSSTHDCQELSNGNIGVIARYGSTSVLIVLNTLGEIVFSKTIVSEGSNNVLLRDIIQTNDHNQLLTTELYGESHHPRLLLSKIDSEGNIIWERCFEYTDRSDYISNVTQSSSGDFYLAGNSNPINDDNYNAANILIHKFNEHGNYISGKIYGGQFQDIGHDIEEDKNGNLLIIANSKPVEVCGDNLVAMSIYPNLDTIFIKNYGYAQGSGALFSELHKVDNLFYTFGSGSLWSNIGPSDGHLIKTNQDFDLECKKFSEGFNIFEPITMTPINPTISHANFNVVLNNWTELSTSTITIKDGCSGESLGIEYLKNTEVTIFPNPSNNMTTIRSDDLPIKSVIVIDVLGNHLRKFSEINKNEFNLLVSGYAKGTYILNIEAGNTIYFKKIIIE